MVLPHLVTSVTCIENGHVLMVKEEDNGIICWNQPAGHVDNGESITDAAVREALEESGYQVALTGLQGIYQSIHQHSGIHYVRFSFYADAVYKTDLPLDADIIEARWLPLTDLLAGKYPLRSQLTRQCLEDHGKAPIYPVNLIQNFTNGVSE